MDPKRELSSVDLRALTGELRVEGAVVDKVYLYDDRRLRFKLRDYDRGRVELFVLAGSQKGLHTVAPDRVPQAPERPPEFAKQLRNRVSGANLVNVEQYGFDRVLRLDFERPDGDTSVVAELFGDGNVAVLDGNGETIACLETVRLKSRTVAPGAPYEYPGERVDPLALEYDAFAAAMRDSDSDLVRTLATQLNFGGLYAEELCTRAGVGKTVSVAAATDDQLRALFDAVTRLAEDLRGGLDPRVYYEPDDDGDGDGDETEASDGSAPGDPMDVTPVPLREYEDPAEDAGADRSGLAAREYDRFDDAVAAYFRALRAADDAVDATPDRPDFEAEIAKYERIVEQQQGAIEEYHEEADRTRERAEALYANYDLADEVLSTVQSARAEDTPWAEIEERLAEGRERGIPAAEAVVDVDASEGHVTVDLGEHRVELDAGEGVEHNADRLYREAKRIEGKAAGAEEALEDTREQLTAVKERRERWESGDVGEEANEDADTDDRDDDVDWLSRASVPVRQEEQWYERFRWFRTSDGFLVLGGRDASQNEELVEKYLESGDRFLHVQSHGGPATVLKAADPSESARDVTIPERSQREAARFAVSYSSVWKAGQYSDDVYAVDHDQVTKTPESGEYLATGGFAIRGDRTYFEDTPVDVAVGVQCEPSTRVIGGPAAPVEARAETTAKVEPGRFAQGDVAKRIYRAFRERFADEGFVRTVASPDRIQHFLPPGTSRIAEE